MNDVIERLERLSANGVAGDWADVLNRAGRQRKLELRRRALIGLAAALLLAVPALALAYRFTEELIVSSTDADPPVAWVAGNRVFNLGEGEPRLAMPLARSTSTSYHFFDSSPATPSPDGRSLVYTAIDPTAFEPLRRAAPTPMLRVHDFATGRDRVLERGADSAAWRRDGALAYVGGLVARTRSLPSGHVFVRRSLSDPAVRWSTRPARYTAIAWAGDHLLVSAVAAGKNVPDAGEGVYAFSGPEHARKLPLGGVVAVDPLGELVIGPETLEPFFAGSLNFRVVRVSDGAVLDELDLPPIINPNMPYASGHWVTGGSWAGDFIVVAATGSETTDALVLLRFEDGQLSPAHVFRLEASSAARAGFGDLEWGAWTAFGNPRFLDDEGDEIVAWATTARKEGRETFISSVFLVCSRTQKECRRTEPLPRLTFPSSGIPPRDVPFLLHAFVENPSRPMP